MAASRQWSREFALDKLGTFKLMFVDGMSHGLALSPVYEDNVPQPRARRWGVSMAKRTRPGFARISSQNAVLGASELLALRAWIDDQLQ